jgi:hypothetical protein
MYNCEQICFLWERNVAHLAEAYIHLSPFDTSEGAVQRLGRQIADLAANAASIFGRPDCIIEVDLESGSLKARARVIGTSLLLVYGAIANYKGFKEGVVEITHDAQTCGGLIIQSFLGANHVPPKSVYRAERRTKTPGRLLRIMNRREWLNTHRAQLSAEAVKKETAAIETLSERALEDLAPEERPVVRKFLNGSAPNLSDQEPEQPVPEKQERVALEEKSRQPELFDFDPIPHGDKNEFHIRFRLVDWVREQSAVLGVRLSENEVIHKINNYGQQRRELPQLGE